MSDPILLCKIDDMNETGAYSAYVTIDGEEQNLIVVIDQDGSSPTEPLVRAYTNVCPHIKTPLETFPNEFLDEENPNYLVCSTHGARFEVSTGACVTGPCMGDSLSAVAVRVEKDSVFLA